MVTSITVPRCNYNVLFPLALFFLLASFSSCSGQQNIGGIKKGSPRFIQNLKDPELRKIILSEVRFEPTDDIGSRFEEAVDEKSDDTGGSDIAELETLGAGEVTTMDRQGTGECKLSGRCRKTSRLPCCKPLKCTKVKEIKNNKVIKKRFCLSPTPTATATQTATPSESSIMTATATATNTHTSTPTATATHTATPSVTTTPTASASGTYSTCPEFVDSQTVSECKAFWDRRMSPPLNMNDLKERTTSCGRGTRAGPRSVKVDAPLCTFVDCKGSLKTVLASFSMVWHRFGGKGKKNCAAKVITKFFPFNVCDLPPCDYIAQHLFFENNHLHQNEIFELSDIPSHQYDEARACGLDDLIFVGYKFNVYDLEDEFRCLSSGPKDTIVLHT